MSTQHNAAAYHKQPRLHQVPIYSSWFFSFCLLILTTGVFSPRWKGPFNWICLWWQNCCSAERRGDSLTECLSRCHGKGGSEWFSVASDFQYLFSIRPHLSPEEKATYREKVTGRNTLTPSFILAELCIQTRERGGTYYTESSRSTSLNYLS